MWLTTLTYHSDKPTGPTAGSENRIEIFDEIANWRAGAKVTLDHASAMFLQDAAVAVTA